MALKPCRECKKKVSTEAATCPSCGVPNPTQKKTTVKPWGTEPETSIVKSNDFLNVIIIFVPVIFHNPDPTRP